VTDDDLVIMASEPACCRSPTRRSCASAPAARQELLIDLVQGRIIEDEE